MSVHVYAGPTIAHPDVRHRLPGAAVHPPVAHGDLLRLQARPGDTVLIIDGDFYDRPPVRNQEILLLLQDGVQVVGAAGMGALRAAELHAYGMVGIGEVFELYRDAVVDADDEVTALPSTESLVNIRCCLRTGVDTGVISAAECARVVGVAESVADRSWPRVEEHLDADLVTRIRELVRLAAPGAQYRDAVAAIATVATGSVTATPRRRVPVTPFVRSWLDRNRITPTDGEPVDDVSVLQFLQLYDPAFPECWTLYTLGVIADGAPATKPLSCAARRALEDRCLERAAVRLGGTRLANSAQRYWLAETESRLDDRDKLLRVLVRSYRAPGGAPIHGCPQVLLRPASTWATASRRVAECRKENRRVAALSPRYSVQRLKRDRVLAHFARIWRVEANRDAVLAAARDRAITSLDQLHTFGREMMLPFLDWTATDAERELGSR